jgi:hypothetical protein
MQVARSCSAQILCACIGIDIRLISGSGNEKSMEFESASCCLIVLGLSSC